MQKRKTPPASLMGNFDEEWDLDLYPIHTELISLVRTLNPFNDESLNQLKTLLTHILVAQSFTNDIELDSEISTDQTLYLQIVLKLHQVLALMCIDFSKLATDVKAHAEEILTQLETKGGLEYVPRERTLQGRLLEHATDTKSLLKHLLESKLPKVTTSQELSEPLFYVSTVGVRDNCLYLTKEYLTLTLSANGKAELYFHAYVWQNYAKMLAKDFPQVLESPEIQRLSNLSVKPEKVLEKIQKFPFHETEYNTVVRAFASLQSGNKRYSQMLTYIQICLFVAQITENQDSLYWLEKILIQLLGYSDLNCRDNAVMLLNSLYDGNDWQQKVAFRPAIRSIGQHFKVNLTIKLANFQIKSNRLFLGVSAPSPLSKCNDTVLTWHKIETRNIVQSNDQETEITINFGKFWKCGFYDWRLMEMSDTGKLNPIMLTKPPVLHNFPISQTHSDYYSEDDVNLDQLIAQGRYIVQPKGVRDETFHEIQVDLQTPPQTEFSSHRFKTRGTFQDVEQALPHYSDSGVSVLYLMGVLERDNCPVRGTANEAFYNSQTSVQMLRREGASALAVTSREVPCEMLGGKPGFQKLMATAKKQQIKIVIDCLARVSSTRHHRKFKSLLLQYLDEDGRRHICYGTDGHAIKYEDTAMLNYRKIEAWDHLVDEVIAFATETGVDGIHLDNGQAWPQILEPDLEELTRVDVDGENAYTAQEILDGEVVIRNENYGYWQTNSMESYANPFFIKLCRKLWSKHPNFMIMGECWGGFKFEHRQIILARSGVIPRLFKLPQTICSIFGKKLHRDGRVTKIDTKESVTAIQSWYEESHLQVPEGSIMIQSSTCHSWPLPAFLYGKGTWAAVDILYLMPDIPITFNGEVSGEIYRIGQTASIHQADLQDVKVQPGLKRSNSQVRLSLLEQSDYDTENEETNQHHSRIPRVRSGLSLADIQETQLPQEEITLKEKKFRLEIGQDYGFDLSRIQSHYEHRRQLRQEKMVLRYGQMCPLSAHSPDGKWLPDLLTFARYSLMETAIIAINMKDSEQTFYQDLSSLKTLFSKTFSDNTVVVTSMLLPQSSKQEYFFLREFLSAKHMQTLIPYSTSILLVTVCPEDKLTFQCALTNSIERTKQKLLSGQNIEADQLSLLLLDSITEKPTDGAYFAGLVQSIKQNFLDRVGGVGFQDLVLRNTMLTGDPKLFGGLLALCQNVAKSNTTVAKDCQNLIDQNKLGPIVFCTPELGRWSTVGGLGVMVDELALSLAKLGQEVIVISPYYERNRQGRTGYLQQDPSGIFYVDNITVSLDRQYTLGVHEGIVGNVRVVFLHHSDIFPMPYADGNATTTVRQISVFGKACLELLCKRGIVPAVCVTNDWFAGFISAYAKIGAFGPTFKGTSFMHICHNLMEDYEGRIYPEPRDGYLQNIHQLPKDWLIDPSWGKNMINPSRTAILLADQWSTVSLSYRDDLMKMSPLSPILKQKTQPFAHPNGIPIAERLKKLDAAAPDHLSAKRIIQMKYFGYQDLDDTIPLFAFVGRITTQKGVALIVDIMEEIITKYNYKVQFLIAGPANMRDPYSANCAHRLRHLRSRFPHCVWAAPEEFFTDGSLINRGSDFGLMPSLFEPGGIVQHEFFVGGTPVIAFKTGGLKDSVIEFQWDTEQGCGFTFESYIRNDFIHACQRALGIFQSKNKYLKLRQNAFEATMPGERVSKAWLGEFYRLRHKITYDHDHFAKQLQSMDQWTKPAQLNVFDQMFGAQLTKLFSLDDIDFGAAESPKIPTKAKRAISDFDRQQSERHTQTFRLHNRGPRHQQVSVSGSWDKWDKKHPMQFDHITNQWFVTLQLQKRQEYWYKYIIDQKQWVMNEEERQIKDQQGNLNNYIKL